MNLFVAKNVKMNINVQRIIIGMWSNQSKNKVDSLIERNSANIASPLEAKASITVKDFMS